MIVVNLREWRRYEGLGELREAFEFLEQHADGSGLEEGRHEIAGERAYALVIEFRPKPASECRFETHPAQIDVIYLTAGSEMIGYAPAGRLGDRLSYDEERGTAFYADPPDYMEVKLTAGETVCVFYPEDGHKPFCRWRSEEPARKVVVKVAAPNLP